MFHDPLKNRSLPRSLTEANISLILKKGKADDKCVSISLLNTDLKLIMTKLDVLRAVIHVVISGGFSILISCPNLWNLTV